MEIISLSATDINSVMDLFCECFVDDWYYSPLLKDAEDRKRRLHTLFRNGVEYCLEEGMSIGIVENNHFIAFTLIFDYKKLQQDKWDRFCEIFGIDAQGNSYPYMEDIFRIVNSIDGNILYILSIAVAEPYRRKGLASKMVDCILEKYREYSIVSDISNKHSLPIYCNRGFNVREVINEYYFIVHKPTDGN